MKRLFSNSSLPERSLLVTCSSHEPRCQGITQRLANWRPASALIFHYDDPNEKREANHKEMEDSLSKAGITQFQYSFTEKMAVNSFSRSIEWLKQVLSEPELTVVLDISVFTKRHLLMLLQLLDDHGVWERLWIAYTEPEEYDVSTYIPLTFGVSSFHQVAGFSACPDLSRPVHLVLFLGYEGDRTLAAYDHVQPMHTTLIIPDPPFRRQWAGRTERFNADLLTLAGPDLAQKVDPLDPSATHEALCRILGDPRIRGDSAKIICPLGTKPQTVGVYAYVRRCIDPPAIIYVSPLRHNHEFPSIGIGTSWILRVN